MSKESVQLKKHELGYLEIVPRPTPQFLTDFYASYFQTPHGNYAPSYSDEETAFFHNLGRVLVEAAGSHCRGRRMIEIGCGEGWDLAAFQQAGWSVKGFDATAVGVQRCNPQLADQFGAFDVAGSLDQIADELGECDLIVMRNVLEHVLDPVEMITELKTFTRPGTVFAIIVPNDDSAFQAYLADLDLADAGHWMAYPDHLQYFNSQTLPQFLERMGLSLLDLLSDYHIENDLLAEHSNYKKNRDAGKPAHHKRVRFINFAVERDLAATVGLLRAQAALGIGRNLISLSTHT